MEYSEFNLELVDLNPKTLNEMINRKELAMKWKLNKNNDFGRVSIALNGVLKFNPL